MRAVVMLAMLLVPGAAVAGLWEDVAAGARGGDERALRAALARAPDDFEARRALAELLSAKKNPAAAARQFERAVTAAPTPTDQARMWFRLANERTRLGAYAQALDAYERQLALGDAEAAALANSGELLMARGQIAAAIDRYREAVALEEREPNRREHLQGMALSYFGLAVALDRQGSSVASREAIGRALALDPGLAVLRVAGQPDSDVFFVPPGEVFYYLALAREAQGRLDDAATSFQDYLRVATGPYAVRAREHLARLMGQGTPDSAAPDRGAAVRRRAPEANAPGAATGPGGWRVLHQATVSAEGPLVAPMIDAAWRLHPRLLDACLRDLPEAAPPPSAPLPSGPSAPAAPPPPWKVSLEMRIEDSGRVGAVTARAPAPLGDALPGCIETTLLNQFRVTRPTRRKATLVRMELVLAPAPPGGV